MSYDSTTLVLINNNPHGVQDAALQQHPTAVALPGDAHRPRSHSATMASPAVRALAREHGLDLSAVTGTGPGGRILKGDVLAVVGQAAAALGAGQAPMAATAESMPSIAPGQQQDTHSKVVPLRGYRRAMVGAMEASNAIPHFHLCDEVDLTQLAAVRQRLRGDALLLGHKLTFLPFVIKV